LTAQRNAEAPKILERLAEGEHGGEIAALH
jgi:hypothetical protein